MEQVYRVVPHENQYFSYILEDLGIPDYRIEFYTSSLTRGKHLLVINSTESQVKRVQSIFDYVDIKDWEIYYTSEAGELKSSNFDKVSTYQNAVDNFMLSSLN
ncbi:multi-sensor signal transduction histidine kinase [Calothrix parasitica NIES-267]|uniref:Multi-sensor signal transduction histidine kinase n=1 Tax=Calothrix parasitica NIES-267 TaxID=1973488 RepID=A0A1Z4LP74_9CYAN|nr:multi-sensor signal transduction histidine kinase [Calothrix parasitica NIES-267]